MKFQGWFGPKTFGWGVSPRSWQGWLVMLIYGLILSAIAAVPVIAPRDKVMYFGSATVALTAVIILTYGKDDETDEA